MHEETSDIWRDYPVAYAQRIISGELSKPEAVICGNDVMADALIAELNKAGIRVPEDIAVTGFDGSLDNAQSDVILTSCQKSFRQLGADAVRRLYSTITGQVCRRISIEKNRIRIGRSCGCIPVRYRTAGSRREQRLLSDHREWFYQSELMFEMMHTETLQALLSVVTNRAYLICHWNQLRIFLAADYLRIVRNVHSLSASKDCCEVLWCDRAGKSSSISDHAMKQSEIIAYLTQEPQHPTAYYLSPLRMEMQQCPEKNWSIQVLCQRTHVSRSYLQRMYKTYFGKSIFEELINFRIQKAKELLRDTELLISEVAVFPAAMALMHILQISLSHRKASLHQSIGKSSVLKPAALFNYKKQLRRFLTTQLLFYIIIDKL